MGDESVETLESALENLATGQEQEMYKGKLALQRLVASVTGPGKEAERSKLAAQLSEAVIRGGKFGLAARAELTRRLGEIGGDPEANTLRSLIVDLELRESARLALDRIPTPGATAALVDASRDAIGARFRAGIFNALGQRTGPGVLEALVEGTKDVNEEVRLAAVEALADHADPAGDAPIVAVIEGKENPVSPRGQARAVKARLRLARNLAQANQKAEAKKVYQSVLDGKPAGPQGKAAQAGLDAIG
jgi:HEAT repeat protein